MDKSIINSIVITPNQINHLLLKNKKNSFNILGVTFFDTGFADEKNFSECIENISNFSNKNKLTNIVIVSDDVLRYVFIYQKQEGANLKATILNDFKNNFDIALNEYFIDYEIYDFEDKNIVFVAGIKRELTEKILKIFVEKGFKLLSLETEINSLKRFLSFHEIEDIFINVHLLNESTLFLIMEKNILFTFRELKFGFKNIIEKISTDTNMMEEEIISEIYEKGFDSERVNLNDAFDRLTIEIQRTIDFYQNQYKYKPVSKFVLTGKLVDIKKIDNFLSNIFMIDCETITPLKKGFLEKSSNDLNKLEYLAEAIGNGLRSI